ncbi:MAG: GDSL-type esterase/lipase family protein [Oscillospiraceae bacterium]|nr:GDSL-type esterase/lipase family protein [Oscillospiraceae bacterium]
MKRILGLLMAAALGLAMLPPVIAAAEDTEKTAAYLALGDSITAGYGLADPDTESFFALLAEEIAASATNAAENKLTAQTLYEALTGGAYDEVLQSSNPDVITLTIGGNDLLTGFYQFAAQIYNEDKGTDLTSSEVKEILSNLNSSSETIMQGISLYVLLNGTDYSSVLVESEEFQQHVGEIVDTINLIAEKLKELCPDAVILIANQYNPYLWLSGCDNIIRLFDAGVTFFNEALENSGASCYTIVDIETVFGSSEHTLTNAAVDLQTLSFDLDFHPNADGHAAIAQAMLAAYQAALEEAGAAPEPAHSWNSGQVTKEATCTQAGEMTYTCTVCGATKTEDIEATGHSAALQNARAATCTEDGYTGDMVCTICGQVLSAGEAISAAGHSWDQGAVTTQATATADGVKTYTCTVCGESKTEAIVATGTDVEEESGGSEEGNGEESEEKSDGSGEESNGTQSASAQPSGEGEGAGTVVSPQTGDTGSPLLWWALLLLLGGVGFFAAALSDKRNRKN